MTKSRRSCAAYALYLNLVPHTSLFHQQQTAYRIQLKFKLQLNFKFLDQLRFPRQALNCASNHMLSNPNHIIQKMHATNVGAHLTGVAHPSIKTGMILQQAYDGPASYHLQQVNQYQNPGSYPARSTALRQTYQTRKSYTNYPNSAGSSGTCGARVAQVLASQHTASAPQKPSTAHTNAKRRAHIKQLLLMPQTSSGAGAQTATSHNQAKHQQQRISVNTNTTTSNNFGAASTSLSKITIKKLRANAIGCVVRDGSADVASRQQQPAQMNLRIAGAARSNDRTGSGQEDHQTVSAESGVNMAVIIGKDKRSTFYDRRARGSVDEDQPQHHEQQMNRTIEETTQMKFMSNNESMELQPEQIRFQEEVEQDYTIAASQPNITAEQLKAIESGKFRRKSGQKKQIEQIKMNFDVVYQPQVNDLFSNSNQEKKRKQDCTMVHSPLVDIKSHRSGKLKHEIAISKTQAKQESTGAEAGGLLMGEDDALTAPSSEPYVYKSPSKMTSPEKKAFSQQLFAHDDRINMKVKRTLQKANTVHSDTLMTIEASKQVISKHAEEQKKYTYSINQHMEQTCNKNQGKYAGRTQNIVEPNLNKRMQARKDRAALLAMRKEKEHFMNQPMGPYYKSEVRTDALEQVREEPNYQTLEPTTTTALVKNYDLQFDQNESNHGNVITYQNQTAEKSRPNSTAKLIDTSETILVTKKPLMSQVLSTKASQAVLNRQLTMQLMPMYRARQRSANLNPIPQHQPQPQPITSVKPQLSSVQESPVKQDDASQFTTQKSGVNQHVLRSATVLSAGKVSRSATKRNSSTMTQPTNQVGIQAAGQSNSMNTCKLPTGKPATHSATIKQHRSKSKKAGGIKTSSKETINSQIRVRKVFIQNSNNHQQQQQNPRINSANIKLSQSSQQAPSLIQMSKSAEGKMPGFNLLTTSKERKRTQQALAPLRQKGQNKGSRKERSVSIKSPQILKSSQVQQERATNMNQKIKEALYTGAE